MPGDLTFFDSAPLMQVDSFTPGFDSDVQITPEQEQAASKNSLGTNWGIGSKLGAAVLGAVPDMVDTVSSSIGLTDRGQITEGMLNAIGSPGLMQFYRGNKGAVQAGSGIASVVAADILAGRFLRPAGAAMRFASKVPYVSKIASLDKQYALALKIAQGSQLRLAKTGAMGIEQYTGAVTVARLGQPGLKFSSANAARNVFTRTAIAKGLVRNATTEGFLAVGANQNEFLFSDDLSENMMWMGVGLGAGAMIDRMMAVHTLKKFANSDIVSREFAKAYDPGGTEADRLKASLYDVDRGTTNPTRLGDLQGHWTDAATSYKISADEGFNVDLLPAKERNPLAPRRNRLATQQEEEVNNLLNKATSAGIAGIPGTAFAMSQKGLGSTIRYMMHRDAGSLFGAEEIGAAVGEGMKLSGISKTRTTKITGRVDEIQQILKDGGTWVKGTPTKQNPNPGRRLKELKPEEAEALRAEHAQLDWRLNLTEVHAIDGEWVPPEVGRLFEDFTDPEILLETSDDLRLWQVGGRKAGDQLGVGNDLSLFLPRGKKLETLGFNDTISLYRAGQKAVRWFASSETKMILPRNANWFQLDMAEDLVRRTGNEDMVQWPAGLTRQDAQVESFKQKTKALAKQLDVSDSTEAMKARYRFNLPRLTSYEAGLMGTEEHPIEVVLRGLNTKPMDDLTYADIVQGITQARQINGMTALTKDRGDTTLGNMFDFMLDDSGNSMKPLVAWKRPVQPFEWTKDNLAERMAIHKLEIRAALTDPKAGAMTRTLTANMLNDPDFIAASQVTGLQDSQLQSFLPGFSSAAPQSTRMGILNDVTSREWRDRDNVTLLAAARLRDKLERQTRAQMKARVEGAMGDVISRIDGPRSGGSKLLLNQALTFRSGWDLSVKKIKGEEIPQIVTGTLKDGRTVRMLKLDPKSVSNQRRWKQAFGRELQDGDVLTAPNGTKIGLDDLSWEFWNRFHTLAQDINREKNTLNKAMGLGEIRSVPLYSPPPNLRGKYVGFTLDLNNKPVPNGTIIAATPEEFQRMRARLEDPANVDSPLLKPGHRFMTQDEITDFNTIWDEAQMHMLDPGTTAIQPGKRAAGTLLGQDVDPNATADALRWVQDSYLKHGHDVLRTVMKDQLVAAETRAQIARESKRNAVSGLREAQRRSIYDFYMENLLGRSAISSPGSFVGGVTRPVENWINSAFRGGKPAMNRVFRGAMDWAREVRPSRKTKEQHEAFLKLRDSLGDYMPFREASEFAERQYKATRPKELAEITGHMSQFEATMRLRMFEIIHPLMNLTGMINSMPSVIRAMQPMVGETSEDFARRVGHTADIFELGDKRIGVLSMPRVIAQTFKRTWDRASHVDWDFMQAHGYVTQEVAEFQRQFGAIKSRDGWRAWALGDPHATNPVKRKGIVNAVSVLSDKSEDFSRSWGHMAGLQLADTLGIIGREARHSFAHDVANKMIANYDPKNRPAIFQGALGAPIGLFQSFIWNFYQRLFRYIETGDARSFATQYATQSALFGVASVPGFNVVNKLFFDHSDGDNSPTDAIYERFGKEGGDFLFGGVVSNITKLVNFLPGEQGVDGVDLYSRGDTNVRLPGFNPPPFMDTVKRVYEAVQQGIAAYGGDNPHKSPQQLAEIASNMLTNRPVAGFIEQAGARGFDTDAYGQVVSESKNAMEAVARIIGVRSMRQSTELEAFYTNKGAMEIQRSQMTSLNRSARAAIRQGDMDALPGYFDAYVRAGGDPKRFNQWMKRNAEAALDSRGERMLDDLSKSENPAKRELMERLLDMGVSIDEDEEGALAPEPYDATNPNMGLGEGPSIETAEPTPSNPTFNEILDGTGGN